ncbi:MULTISPECIES: hypothetical protein [Gammaproteobacteria]|uniref:hypothetical protein n=1 Tax=Gammaproteobacteria TaxID=1236 RepID=UPI000F8137CC|nr:MULTISPECIES: hypothetical protein [Gammaproteobacteria]RTE87431.1 hypothetical protein DQX04_03320 [Aliidiomarina sp. B3213]TCZ92784.1 hypothetical protein EYQ95_01985 [Lysobacter sp. N42]
MNLQLRQSRKQNIIDRIYRMVWQVLLGLIPLLVLSVILNGKVDDSLITMIAVLTGIWLVGVPLWMMFYNRGNVAVLEYGLDVDDVQIRYTYYDMVTAVDWDNYNGFEISLFWPKRIKIMAKEGKTIELSYYTFSAEQRKQIFRVLSEQREKL